MIFACVSYVQMLVMSWSWSSERRKGRYRTEPILVASVPIPEAKKLLPFLGLHERLLVGVVMVARIFASDMQSVCIGWW